MAIDQVATPRGDRLPARRGGMVVDLGDLGAACAVLIILFGVERMFDPTCSSVDGALSMSSQATGH